MSIYSMILLDGNNIIENVYDLSSFGYFERNTIKEFIIFTSKLIVKNVKKDAEKCLQTIEHDIYNIHIKTYINNLTGIIITNKIYPTKYSYMILNELFSKDIKHVKEFFNKAIVEYQDPNNVDKLDKINKELDHTIEIVHKTIDSILDRGVKLEKLIKDSEDLSKSSKIFYQQASSRNKCCIIS